MIYPIPAFQDNYFWALTEGKNVAIVDPGDAKPVLDFLSKQTLELTDILITHHHADHIGGIPALKKAYPKVRVFGPETIDGITHPVREHNTINVLNFAFNVIAVPGHTLDHIAYYTPGHLFCGDTLFSAGCGRLFEGTPAQMLDSLNKIRALPDDTLIYCAHEYTLSNLAFAETIEPDNPAIETHRFVCENLRSKNEPTLPSRLDLEKQLNPFLRVAVPAVIKRALALGASNDSPLNVFTAIREAKDTF